MSEANSAPQIDEAKIEAIRVFVNWLEKGWLSAQTNPLFLSDDRVLEGLDNGIKSFASICSDADDKIQIGVKPQELFFEERSVYTPTNPSKSLSLKLYDGGLRMLVFHPGLTAEELRGIAAILAVDLNSPEMMDQDLYSLFIENIFDHFEGIGDDLIREAAKKDPRLKENMSAYLSRVQHLGPREKRSQPRQLREDDLNTLQSFEFQPNLDPAREERFDQIVKSLIANREAPDGEKDVLERLMRMGLHYLHGEGDDVEKVKVGRDIVSYVNVLMLESKHVQLFLEVLKKIFQIIQKKPEHAKEYSEVLELVFHTKHVKVYSQALYDEALKGTLSDILARAGSRAFRLTTLLIDEHPELFEKAKNTLAQGYEPHISWIKEQVLNDPENETWDKLLEVIAARPNKAFYQYVELLLSTRDNKGRERLLGQLAKTGNKESVRILDRFLKSDNKEDRLLVLQFLFRFKPQSKLVVQMLVSFLSTETFLGSDHEVRMSGYAALARIAGKQSWPFFQKVWNEDAKGLFKSKALEDKRHALLAGLMKGSTEMMEQVEKQLPLDKASNEIKQLLETHRKRAKGEY